MSAQPLTPMPYSATSNSMASPKFSPMRVLLYGMVASVALTAVFGIYVILLGRWGEFEFRVLATTMIIAAGCVCGLACNVAIVPKGLNLMPRAGQALTALSTVLWLFVTWDSNYLGDKFLQVSFTVTVLGVALVHLSLLSVANLVGWFRWVYYAAVQVIFGLAALIILVIWANEPSNSDAVLRAIAALSILASALSLIIPILHRIGNQRMKASGGATRQSLSPIEQTNIQRLDERIGEVEQELRELKALRLRLLAQAGVPAGPDESPAVP